ncbi:MAG: DoxX family membrane protein [Mycetocola sp.]
MDIIILVGRILFCFIFLGGAAGHLTQTAMMAGIAEQKKVPAPRAVVLITGVLLVAAALMIIVGAWADLAALGLFLFLVPTAFVMHNFWAESDPQVAMLEQLHFLKDMSLAGACLIFFGLLNSGPDLGLFLTGPLFS